MGDQATGAPAVHHLFGTTYYSGSVVMRWETGFGWVWWWMKDGTTPPLRDCSHVFGVKSRPAEGMAKVRRAALKEARTAASYWSGLVDELEAAP